MAGLLNPCLTDVKLVCSGRGRGVALHTKQRKFAFHRLKLDHPLPSPHDDRVNTGNVVSIIPIFLCHCIQHQRDHCFEVFYNFLVLLLFLRFLKELYTVLTYKQETTWSTIMRKKCCTMVITHQSGIHLDKSRTGVIVTIKVAAVSKWRDSDKTVEHKLVNWTLHTFRGELLPVYPHCPKYPLAGAIVIIKGVLRQLAEWSWEWNNGTE